jgi:hypothetical protein
MTWEDIGGRASLGEETTKSTVYCILGAPKNTQNLKQMRTRTIGYKGKGLEAVCDIPNSSHHKMP